MLIEKHVMQDSIWSFYGITLIARFTLFNSQKNGLNHAMNTGRVVLTNMN